MQIRYLEAMQAMARSANSKVIFMPGPSDSGNIVDKAMEDDDHAAVVPSASSYRHQPNPLQQTVNARVLQDM